MSAPLLPVLALLQKGGAAAGPMGRVTSPTIVAVALAYFAVIVAISVWAARRTRTASDFFVAAMQGLVARRLIPCFDQFYGDWAVQRVEVGEAMLDRLMSLYQNAADRVVLVVNPAFSRQVRDHVARRGDDARVDCVSPANASEGV